MANNQTRTIEIWAKKMIGRRGAYYKYLYYSSKRDIYFEVRFSKEIDNNPPEKSFKAKINVDDMIFRSGIKDSYMDRDNNKVEIERNVLWIRNFEIVPEGINDNGEDCDLYI